jgi:hypothetical protein
MPDARDVRSVMEAAEQAAGAGDYASARDYLRHAIELQEASVGPTHPDLAKALNNLGVVYERQEKPAEAEECYRRAYAIARAAFEPDHPILLTSASNLREFCEARGLRFDLSAGMPATAAAPPGPLPEAPPLPAAQPPEPAPPPSTAVGGPPEPASHAAAVTARAGRSTSPAPPDFSMGLLIAAGLIIGAVIVIGLIAMQSRSTGRARQAASVTPPVQVDGSSSAARARNVPRRGDATRKESPRPAGAAPGKAALPAGSAPTIAAAELCRMLQTGDHWQCAPAAGTLQPGVVFFYTRLLSPTDTTVQHRWYRGDRLHQTVTLRVHANQRAGYRTYSQMTVSAERAGDWRVELRTADGTVLHEERFTVGH